MEDQIKALQIYIQRLEDENQYLKSLLDGAGIDYAISCAPPESPESCAGGIKNEIITQDHVLFFYSMFKGRKDVYSLRSGKPNTNTGKHGYYPQCENIWSPSLC